MYEKYYQFNNLPFRLSPDPSFFFGSKGHNRALSYLRYGLAQKEGFIVITGTPGTGKTTIARSLLQEIGKDKIVVSELNTTHLQAEDVLRMVAASFGLEHEGASKSTILKRLEAFCISRFRAGYHVLLIVDESQNLPPESLEELRMLSNFYLGKDALIQIFLLGQQQFRDNLYSKEMEQLRQRVVASCHLEPLNITETREYIEYRLKHVGWDYDPQISDRAFARIFAYTKGVPRRINTFCDRLFLFGAIEEIHHIQDEHVKEIAKELAYEVSAEGIKLDDISPESLPEGEIEPGTVEIDKPAESERDVLLNTEQLQKFSDEPIDEAGETEIGRIGGSKLAKKIDNGLDEFYPDSNNLDAANTNERENILPFSSHGNAVKSVEVSSPASLHQIPSASSSQWWELLSTCAEYYRQPAKFRGVSVEALPIEGISELLQVADGSKEIPDYVRTGLIENLADEEIKEAIVLYIQNVLLSSASDYYRRLGVKNNASMELVKAHYKLLFRLFQPDSNDQSVTWDETYARRINQAYSTLRSAEKRQEYDRFLALRSQPGLKRGNASVLLGHDGDGSNSGRSEVSHDFSDPGAFTPADNLKATLYEPKTKWSLVASVAVMLFGGLAAIYMYQPGMKQLIAFDTTPVIGPSISDSTQPIVATTVVTPPVQKITESAELEKILAPIESIFIPKPNTLQEIASAVEETIKSSIGGDSANSGLSEQPAQTEKKVLQARIERTPVAEIEKKPVSLLRVAPAVTKVVKEAPAALDGEKLAMFSSAPILTAPNAVAKREPIDNISNTELKSFIAEFSIAYEEGNLGSLMRLFTADAVVNDTKSKAAIKADYASLFSSTEMRVIDLHGLSWDVKKESASGQGEFLITVLKKGSEAMKNFSGTIRLDVAKSNGKLMLEGMRHTYGLEN